MINNNELNILKMQEKLGELTEFLLGEWQDLEIHQVEKNVFSRLLEIGRLSLIVYSKKKGSGADAFGEDISEHSKKTRYYLSIFGEISLERSYFWKKGKSNGVFPIDKELNLPKKIYSYVLQEWNQLLAVDENYESARETLERIFGINLWTKQSEEINRDSTKSVEEFYKRHPEEEQEEPILVVQADGKGVVMRKDKSPPRKQYGIRLKKGEKNGKKKMATVTAVYGIERNIRKPEDILKHEIGNNSKKSDQHKLKIVKDDGPKPQKRRIRATLKGKDLAFKRIVSEVESRDPNNRLDRVLLVDGERALETKAREYLTPIGFIIILDLFHVTERLWMLCYFFCKEGTKESMLWVEKYLKMILHGKVGYFIGAIRQILKKGRFSESKKERVENLLRYYEKRKNFMKYDQYLAKGYPIGSGVIEGACRSFVKDRMELSGMRWSEEGAESMLELRSIKINGKWDEFWKYYITKEKQRRYGNISNYFGIDIQSKSLKKTG